MTRAAASYRGGLHQVVVVVSIIRKDVLSEPRGMARAVIRLCFSKQKSENMTDLGVSNSKSSASFKHKQIISLVQWLSTRAISLPQGCLATSGDIFGCHNMGWGPSVCHLHLVDGDHVSWTRQTLTTNSYLTQSTLRLRNSDLVQGKMLKWVAFLSIKILFRGNTL